MLKKCPWYNVYEKYLWKILGEAVYVGETHTKIPNYF